MELCLFNGVGDAIPNRRVRLDPAQHRTGDYWHCRVEGIGPGQHYGWRLDDGGCAASTEAADVAIRGESVRVDENSAGGSRDPGSKVSLTGRRCSVRPGRRCATTSRGGG